MINKKGVVFIIVLILCLCFFLQACSPSSIEDTPTDGQPELSSNGEPYIPNTDPVPWEGLLDDTTSEMLGINNETEYTQIVVEPVKEVYSLSEDKAFSCNIINNHIGHGFYIYGAVYIDKLIDNEWVRQCNKYAVDSAHHLQWLYIGVEGNVDGVNSTRDGIAVKDILPAVTPGRYRLVVFLPTGAQYAEFDVVS